MFECLECDETHEIKTPIAKATIIGIIGAIIRETNNIRCVSHVRLPQTPYTIIIGAIATIPIIKLTA